MGKDLDKGCLELKDIQTDTGPLDEAIMLATQSRRGAHILSLLEPMTKLVNMDDHIQIRIEPVTPGIATLTSDEAVAINHRLNMLNAAIRNGDIVVTPGISSISIINKESAINALAPGIFTPETL